jgi:hypothetical protein
MLDMHFSNDIGKSVIKLQKNMDAPFKKKIILISPKIFPIISTANKK